MHVRLPHPLRRFSLLQRFAVTSFVVFVLIGLVMGAVIGNAVKNSALNTSKTTAIDSLQSSLHNNQLTPTDLQGTMTPKRLVEFDHYIRSNVINDRTVVVKVWNPRGVVVYSTDPTIIGKKFKLEDDVATALAGNNFANVTNLNSAEDTADRKFGQLLQVYIPIRMGHATKPVGAFEIYETYQPVANQITMLQHQVYVVLGISFLFLYLLLFGIVRAGSKTIQKQNTELGGYTDTLERSYRETIMSLASAVDARDSQTESHSQRVTTLALDLGQYVGLPEDQMRSLQTGALLHDIGKIGVPDGILLKPDALTDEEWKIMRSHPMIGYEMLKEVTFLHDSLPVIRSHHERWDGAGYPDRLAGAQIPLAARIFGIVDAFDAITSDRPYRTGSSLREALHRIEVDAGTHFDPVLALLFVGMMSPKLAVEDVEHFTPEAEGQRRTAA